MNERSQPEFPGCFNTLTYFPRNAPPGMVCFRGRSGKIVYTFVTMELAYRLILYILIANTGFMIFSLARRGWRANAGYLIQLTLILLFMVAMLVWGNNGFWAVVVSTGCLIVSVIIPFFLQRRLENLLAEQRFDEIETVAWWKAALAWSEVNSHLLSIGRIASHMNDSPTAVENSLKELLGKGEPFDGITRLFMAMLHFHQRRFAEIVEDLAAPGRKEEDLSFEEMLYLVRGYLETQRFEDACRIQKQLEQRAIQENSPHTSGNLLVSRLIFFSLMGWKNDFQDLLVRHPDLKESLPEILRDFWEGVTTYQSGEPEQGLTIMETALQKSNDEIPEHWMGWMRQRIDELRSTSAAFLADQLPRLKQIFDEQHHVFLRLVTESEPTVTPPPVNQSLTHFLLYTLVVCYVLSFSLSNPEDIVQLIHLGANCSLLVQQGEWFRLFTGLFLHMGLVHLFMNLLALKYFGPPLETVIGSPLLLGVFFFSGLCGSLASVWQQTGLSVGASGAVLGLLSGAIVVEWMGGAAAKRLAKYENLGTLLFILGVNLLIGTVEKGIDNSAHIGGLAGGAVSGLLVAGVVHWPRVKKIAEWFIVFIVFTTLGLAGYQYFSVRPELQYPNTLQPLEPPPGLALPLEVSIPPNWISRVASNSADLQELTLQGPFGERIDFSWGINSEPPSDLIRKYAEDRTRTLASDELVQLKSVVDPATFTLGIWSGYRVQWRLAAQSHPLIIRDYALFQDRKMILLQCLLPTEQAHHYDSLMQKILESIRLKKGVDDEEQ